MKNTYTVSQVNRYVKNMFAQDYLLKQIYVKGEVSNCTYHRSGHIYFSLKDETGVLSCVMFAGNRRGLAFQMKNGDKVIVGGYVSIYEERGNYQLYAREIVREGLGELYEQYLRLKAKLEEMGMFDPAYKQELPRFIKTLGIVASPTGATVHDIRRTALARNPYLQIVLYPAKVQGHDAPESIVNGIETLDRAGVDVIILVRGGGSAEDLWAFNEESVAWAVFNCATPIISAVGHAPDVSITDGVADATAITPTGAAQMAVDDMQQIFDAMTKMQDRLHYGMNMKLNIYRERLSRGKMRLAYLNPRKRLEDNRQKKNDLEQMIRRAMADKIRTGRHELGLYLERYRGLSPLNKLNQGYSYVAGEDGRAVTSVAQAEQGDKLEISVTDGVITAEVTGSRKEEWSV